MTPITTSQIEISENQLLSENSARPWSSWKKFGFRFLFITTCLFIVPAIPLISEQIEPIYEVINPGIVWVAKNIFNVTHDILQESWGSGDTTYAYLYDLIILCISLIGAVCWSVLDRNKINYERLYYWLLVHIGKMASP